MVDLASDASACFGDNDALACYMVPLDVAFLALPFVPGVADNVLRRADDVGDVAEDVGQAAVRGVDDFASVVDDVVETATDSPKRTISKRQRYVGRTPGKRSRTGREVLDRMRGEGRVIDLGDGDVLVKGRDGVWYPLEEMDMGHIEDVVLWWNREGYKYGPRSKEVREWMLDPTNYELEHYSINRSRGGRLKETYRDLLP